MLALSGREIPLTASSVLTKDVWRKLVFSFITSEQIETLAQLKKLDLAVDLKEIGQFRALVSVVDETYNLSIYAQGRVPAAVAAVAPAVAPAEPAPPSQPPPAPSASTAPAAPAAPVTPQAAASPAPAPVVVAAPAIQVPGLMPGQVLGLPVPASHPYREGDVSVDELLAILLDKGGSDLHLHERKQPLIRTDGRLIIAHEKPIDDYNMMAIIEHVTNETERALLFARDDLDTAYNMKALSRFRVNILRDTRGWGMVLRVIPFKIPVWKDLGVPESAHSLVFKPHGLFLVTGPTGSGKSTTLASLIHDVNQTHYKHIVTIEDPIEFVHNDIKCCVTQREVGVDTPSFARGVVDVLRQDPDLILVGEMRDLETMANALLAAESGRLVLATLHTTSCAQTIERIINVFPEEAQNVARSQLANSIVGILSQSLLPKKGGGRIAAFEVMIATESVRNLLRENKPQMLQTSIETGAKFGMRSLDQHLLELVEGGQVAFEDAYAKCQNTKNFKALEAKLKGVPVAALAEE
ncbi:MAG: PilT/PilU family type 4a pilus ATPase [Candidatus Wallbacteria bacterium]|nr:PilT/PilU family type 4a pilus ATPase [Candidatus Wallbacteria bacterium]